MDSNVCKMQADDAQAILMEQLNKGKIKDDMCNIFKQKLEKLLTNITNSYVYRTQGQEKYNEQKRNLINEKVKLEQAHNAQNENQLILQELNHVYNMAKNELLLLKEKDQALDEKLQNLYEEMNDKNNRIEKEKEDAKAEMMPKMLKIEAQIKELNEELKRQDGYIAKEKEELEENQERKDYQQGEVNALKDDIAAKQEDISKVKDEPHRLEKGAYILKDSCTSLGKLYFIKNHRKNIQRK